MAWKWYEVTNYKASVGGVKGDYYGIVQLLGVDFYGVLYFHKAGSLPNATAPVAGGQRFYGHMDYQQMDTTIDLLRNEGPSQFGWYEQDPNLFQLMTGAEAVGEGDGVLVDGSS